MCSLLGQHSSIHHEGSAGGKFRVVGAEIENRRGDFFAGANAPDRMKRRQVIAHLAFFSGKTIDHLGCDTGGGPLSYPDTFCCEINPTKPLSTRVLAL